MNFEEEFAAFLRENGLDGTGFIAVPVKARSPREAAALSEALAAAFPPALPGAPASALSLALPGAPAMTFTPASAFPPVLPDDRTLTGAQASERLAVLSQTAEADGDRKEDREEKGGLAIETGGPERQTHGERPVFIVEDRWRSQGEQVKARLLAHCRRFAQVYARNCEVRRIDKPTAAAFLERTHSYGDAACRYRYGLYVRRLTGEKNSADIGLGQCLQPARAIIGQCPLPAQSDFGQHPLPVSSGQCPLPAGKAGAMPAGTAGTVTCPSTAETSDGKASIGPAETLVAVGEFSSARTMKDGRRSYEWVRYASEPGVRVVGGMGKVLQKFVDDVHPDDVMTYADLEWSDGGAYRALGFEPEGLKAPVTFAIDTRTWTRTALKPGNALEFSSAIESGNEPGAVLELGSALKPGADAAAEATRYYRNFGSLKYRKTLPTCGKIPQDNGKVAPTCGKIPQDK